MAQKIESDKLYVKDVFNRWYRIPEYQRPYVWDTEQVQELLSDITNAYSKNYDSEYFLGSLVFCHKQSKDKDTTFEECDLLDGQQRVTTLFLIIATIRDLSDTKEVKDACQPLIFQTENSFNGTPERLRIVFDIRDQVKDFVNEYVKKDGSTNKIEELKRFSENKDEDTSIQNMAKAILTIRTFFENNSYQDFLKFLLQKVLLIYVSAEELEDAFRLFTVMNSRGVKLRNSDILKAENLALVDDDTQRQKYATEWEETESFFGEDFDNFLSHLRTILVKQKATVSLLKEFEENIYNPRTYHRETKEYHKANPLLNKGASTFSFVLKYKKHYEFIFEKEHKNNELYNRLWVMRKGFEADYWIAPLLRYCDKFNDDLLLQFVKALDNKFAHDWIIGHYPTQRIERVNSIIQAIDDATIPQDVLHNKSLELDDISSLKANLEGNIYGKRTAKYILLRLDMILHGHNQKKAIPDTISIEHILPQNPKEDSQWCIDFTGKDRDEWTHKIGNLALLSRRKNSSQNNRDYTVKKERYFKGNIELFSNSIRIYQEHSTWRLEDLKKNQDYVSNKLISSFTV